MPSPKVTRAEAASAVLLASDCLTSFSRILNGAGPSLLFGLRLWASVCLALYVAFWLELDRAYWAGITAAIVCQPHLGASLRKGWFRMVGTIIGATAVVVLTACFPQDRALFLTSLALWGAVCVLAATLLRNSAAYAAALAGFTAVIIASDQLGATGGPDGQAITLAINRTAEICIGIVAAGLVLTVTDLGGARWRLAQLFASVVAELWGRFTDTLVLAGPDLPNTGPIRRELVRKVVALEAVVDEAFGESAEVRSYSPTMQAAIKGLLGASAAWRTVAAHIERLQARQAQQAAGIVLETLAPELRAASPNGEPDVWLSDPAGFRNICETSMESLAALPVGAPSQTLLVEQTRDVLTGITRALDGLALLVGERPQTPSRISRFRIQIPDQLPALVNAWRAFAAIGAAAVFWIVTGWPHGAQAMAYASVAVILFAPRADAAYATVLSFVIGAGIAALSAAVIAFAVLPQLDSFAGFGVALGLVLVPAGAGIFQPWQNVMFTAIGVLFVPMLAPANQMNYDSGQFYNNAMAILAGTAIAALSFRLLPSPSPAFQARRLLTLTLLDLQRLATVAIPPSLADWGSRIYARFLVLPNDAQPLQRSQLLVALSVGAEIIKLRALVREFEAAPWLETALEPIAHGHGALAVARLAAVERILTGSTSIPAQRARASILALLEALTRHATYFDIEVTP